MGLALASVLAMIGLFVAVIVVSFELLHGDRARERASSLEPVQLLGSEERVFNWARDRCSDDDIPDLPARAFRDSTGRVQLISSTFVNRRFVGSSLNRMAHQCRVTMASGNQPDPQLFNDREWLAAPYTIDGRTIFALVHNEYQGQQHPGRCPSNDYFQCWYNAVTLAVSYNSGNSFRDARPPPGHLVASAPYRYRPDGGTYGVFSPSNIVRKDDGYYYTLVATRRYRQQPLGACLLRTNTLADPSSWRAWNGSGFRVAMVSPYRPQLRSVSDRVCEPVSAQEIGGMHESLTYNTYLGKYLLVGVSADRIPGRRGLVYGIYYSASEDLIDWTQRKLIREAELPWTYECGDGGPVLYPSVLDPGSRSRNFETTGRRPYLYFTRNHYRNCTQTLNRDLIRVQVEFRK